MAADPRKSGTGASTRLMEFGLAAGATAAEAQVVQSQSTTISCRDGEYESSKLANSSGYAIRAFVGQRSAVAVTSKNDDRSLEELANRAVAMAKLAPEDPYNGLVNAADLCADPDTDLDTYDDARFENSDMLDRACEAEAAAMAVKGVTRSMGASVSQSNGRGELSTSNGFHGVVQNSRFATGCSVIAEAKHGMESESYGAQSVYRDDLESAADIGREAGERAASRIDRGTLKGGNFPVVFDTKSAAGLLGNFAAAISGQAIVSNSSFLAASLGEPVFSSAVNIVDDPRRRRSLGARACDGEGVAAGRIQFVEAGVLTAWTLTSMSAKRLNLPLNGRASRGLGGAPTPSVFNLYMEAGECSLEELIADIGYGVYVTKAFGQGVNTVSGDYSRAASGFLIENGKISHAVSNLTLAANMKDMFLSATPANDLTFTEAMNCPSLRLDGMTVSV